MLKNQANGNLLSRSGFSLVELLVALLLGALLLTMVIGLYVSSVTSGAKKLKSSRLRSDLQSIVAIIETDIRRAGYGDSAGAYLVGSSATKTIDINNSNDCIVYYYNHNNSVVVERSNKMAFSLKNGAIKFKTGVGQVANDACAVTTGWLDVSDVSFIKITALSFTEIAASNAGATLRSVKISLAGELVSDSDYKHAITTRVQVRNIELND